MSRKFLRINTIVALGLALSWVASGAAQAQDSKTAKKIMIHRCLLDISLQQYKRDEAMKEYNAILALAPNDASMHHDFGRYLWKEDKGPQALAQLRTAVKIEPTNADYNATLGRLELQLLQTGPAVEHLKKAAQFATGSAAAQYSIEYQRAAEYQAKNQQVQQYKKQVQQQQQKQQKEAETDEDSD